MPKTSKNSEPENLNEKSHRGAFGEYGADDTHGFIDRTFVERILLVGVVIKGTKFNQTLNSLKELAQLVRTAGANPIEKILIKRDAPHPGTYIGKGKVEELYETCEQLDIDSVIFDNDLTASQQVNLEKAIKRSAIDRTTVILDIFAQNASSQEGKVQVELAQMKHRTAKLKRKDATYSQQAGGIGSRGPGETKLESDRRLIFRRIRQLEKQLESISKRRKNQSKRRLLGNAPNVALVGYTNAGKSSFLNALTGASAISKNKLFSTLEATTRKLSLGSGQTCLLTDTVGFIRKLPHTLIDAFASTLSGIAQADLLIHTIDATVQDVKSQIQEVNNVLEIIEAENIPQLLVFNKIDLFSKERGETELSVLKEKYPTAFFVSVKTGEGLEELVNEIPSHLFRDVIAEALLLIPHSQGDVIADIHRSIRILDKESTEEGMLYKVELLPRDAARFSKYQISDNGKLPEAKATKSYSVS